MKKALSLILTLALLLSAMLGVTSAAEGESGAELNITSANLQFASTVYLLVSVDYSAYGIDENGAMSAVTLTVTGKDGVESAPLSADAEVMATEGFPEGAVGFKYTDLGAKNMGDELTLQAYYNGEKSGDPTVYSVLEYTIKAKETYPSDAELALVCDTLIAFGAEAQKAFGYTGDFDLSEKYGMVIVGGATNRKTIAKVGETVTPEMNADAFPAGAELYGINFEKADSVVVKEGVSRYFYFGTDIYGDKAGAYTTATDHTGTDLNMAKLTKSGTYIFDKDNDSYTNATSKSKSGNVMFQMPYNKPNAWDIYRNQAGGWGETSATRYISVTSSDKTQVLNYSGGSIVWEAGKYLLINSVSTTGTTSPWTLAAGPKKPVSAVDAQPFDPDNFLNKDGKFTIGFNIAKKQGVDFSTTGSVYNITSAGGTVPLFSVSGSSLVYGDTKLVDFVEFNGDAPESAEDYTSFYIVVNVNANTMTVYSENGNAVSVALDLTNSGQTNMKDFLSGDQGFSWNFPSNGGQAYINRITYMIGDIFA